MALVLAQCRTHTSGALGSMGWAPLVPSGDPTDIPSLLKLNILEEFSSSTKGLIFYLRWMLSDCCWHSSVKWIGGIFINGRSRNHVYGIVRDAIHSVIRGPVTYGAPTFKANLPVASPHGQVYGFTVPLVTSPHFATDGFVLFWVAEYPRRNRFSYFYAVGVMGSGFPRGA